MPVPILLLVAGLFLLAYLSTFVVFAVLRFFTGVSIQRIGHGGFRRISFTPRNGVKVSIRGVGLAVHRPTFALPTWCSLVITELVVTVDLHALQEGRQQGGLSGKSNGTPQKPNGGLRRAQSDHEDEEGHGKLWRRLTEIKERIKRLHSKINWIKLVDLVASSTTLEVISVGTVRLDRVTVSVDTRSKIVDRSRLFQHHKTKPDTLSPAEWRCLVRSVLFTPEGRDSSEILDYCTLNIHGMLHNRLQGLRDASVALKLGRLNLPFDDIEYAKRCAASISGRDAQPHTEDESAEFSFADALEELEKPGSREARIVRTVSDSRAFIASILRGIQEMQFAVSFIGLSRRLDVQKHPERDVYFNLAMKEVGLDILRLDPKSPAHRMYFDTKDVAHQGLLTAIAISAGIDDGHEHPERLLYVPMVTATVKTTLPSRTILYNRERDAKERNTNILYANLVCTSPSIDLDPKHMPLLREILERPSTPSRKRRSSNRHHIVSQLLPKAHIKFSVQEPVVRVSLPPMDKSNTVEGDFDMLISSVSSISFELESSHAADTGIHYSLASHYRHTKHHLYYQTVAGEHHDLLQTDTVEAQIKINGIPDATVTANAQLRSFTLFLVRPDICEGVRQIVKQLRKRVTAGHEPHQKQRASFLRTVPPWLETFKIEGTDFGLELAGVDEQVSQDSRGFVLQLESWTTEYKAHREESTDSISRRRSIARPNTAKDKPMKLLDQTSPRKRYSNYADGRRLAVHLQNLEGFIIDSVDDSEPEPFVSMPRFEVAFSTSTDANGPLFHINSHARSILLQYSLYNHFAIGVAAMVIKRTFVDHDKEPEAKPRATYQRTLNVPSELLPPLEEIDEIARHEITTTDFKANLLQVKARLPSDPPMMLQLYGLDTGRHRWASPFARCRLARLYVRAPKTEAAWSRIVSVKVLRLDLRDVKRKVGKHAVTEKSIDAVAEVIRFAIPHSLVVHNIFDNFTNVLKTTKQLVHHFLTETNEYVLVKEPQGPKHVPRVTVRTGLFLFDIEDSSFEWKLGAIYRTGLLEQKQRLAREEAFNLKAKRIGRGAKSSSSRTRAHSAHLEERSRSYSRLVNVGKRRSRSTQAVARSNREKSHHQSQRKMRYDAEGKCGISDTSQVNLAQAREKLHRLNAQSWKTRIDRSLAVQSHTVRDIRRMIWGSDETPEDSENQEPILAMSQRPSLMLIIATDFSLTVDKPSFPLEQYPTFLHDVGKGMPYDMKYGLLVPMNLHVTMGELRFHLRDYPLPLLHVPPLANGQSPRLPALSMKTDFVVAEEFRDVESQRHANVVVVPAEKISGKDGEPFSIDVRRAISPIKTYSDMKFEINTSNPTKITWGTSYQPAIQDTMQVIESLTKPPLDPSDRVGFWDKVRLSFHSRVNIAWKEDGDFQLVLKGSRDPYAMTGDGAGLVMVWRNDVCWNIAQSKDPRQFMTVDASDYLLAVPDFNAYARRNQQSDEHGDDASSTSSMAKRDAVFKKVVMKLSGKVRWLAGLVFERDTPDGKRLFDFKPHYDVVLKNPAFAKAPPGEEYDAYRGFRSHHIHMSIAVSAPHDRDWSVANLKTSSNYNTVHLTPRFFSHFLSWWRMFSGFMSLPVRQGPLWSSRQKKSKKFGRHIATIKYNLLLSPLFISHVYKHKDAEEYQGATVSVTGLKMKLDSFMLDLHQRREHFNLKGSENLKTKKTSTMKINQAQLDFISADLRALCASVAGTSADDIDKADDETLASLHGQLPTVDVSKFDIPDKDYSWIDMDDFVELDWILPAEGYPVTKILPLGFAPRFTYFRQIDHHGVIAGDTSRTSQFGDEPTHYCVMSVKNDPRAVQAELIERRLTTLKEQKIENERALGEQELKEVRQGESDVASKQKLEDKVQALQGHREHLQSKHDLLQSILSTLTRRLEQDDPSIVPELETSEEFFEAHEHAGLQENGLERMDTAPLADYTSDFNNRFIVHNAQIKWNNSLRNIILRYVHQVSQRRGFVYYMSRRAVKFIIDVIEGQRKSSGGSTPTREQTRKASIGAMSSDEEDEQTIQDRIDQLLKDGRSFVDANEPASDADDRNERAEGPTDKIADDFIPLNIYHFRLIAPQIQLQSEKNPKAAVLVTAKGMQLKIVEIMDKDNVHDDVSGLVQRRFNAAADSLQMYVTSTKAFSTELFHMYSANLYGAKAGTKWPPWVPMEIMFEYEANPYGFSRVVRRTSASLRYDKYNNLRLKYRDNVTGETPRNKQTAEGTEEQMDQVWLDFPHFRAICDSAQYYAMYIIVMDLLLYSEPLVKTRSERLEKIMLASDFSDLTGAPETVEMLQERIRQLEEIKMHFQINEKYLDRQGWKDRITIDHDLASCEDELFFMLKAITRSQQRVEDRRELEDSSPLVHLNMTAKEIAWHLIREKAESLVEFQLRNASFDRTDYNDGSNYNLVEIERINGYNLLPDALYPQIIAPFADVERGGKELSNDTKMLRVNWLMLEAIAGIPVVDYFEIDLVPLKMQVERDIAKKVFEYIFPGVGGKAFEGSSGSSALMVKKMAPTQEEGGDEDSNGESDTETENPSPPLISEVADIDPMQDNATGAGSLERRLKPTLHLPKQHKPKTEGRGLGISRAGHGHGFGGIHIFQHSDRSKSSLPQRSAASRQALASTNTPVMSRSPSERSLKTMRSTTESIDGEKSSNRRFPLHRSQSSSRKIKRKKKKNENSDDLTQMVERASNYMTLAFVKIPSLVLCLSYKGQGKRNLEDVHDLVFRLPTLEYRNKTWSNLDLALQLKKDVIRALISHAGAIVSNKFSYHKPNKQQQSRLRELASMSTFLSLIPTGSDSATPSEASSSVVDLTSSEMNGRPSSASATTSTLNRSVSFSSMTTSSLETPVASPPVLRRTNQSANGITSDAASLPPQLSAVPDADAASSSTRSRTASITRHFSGFGERRKQRQTASPAATTSDGSAEGEETDETKQKGRFMLGGQRLLRALRDQ